MKIVVTLILSLISFISVAQTWVQVNGVSVHDQPGYNAFNYGAGLEHTVAANWTVAGGWYRNSVYRGSFYAYGRYAFYQQDAWNLGVAVGAVTGYNRAQVVPMAFPEACYGWTCALFLPRVEQTGASVIGVRLRIPIN